MSSFISSQPERNDSSPPFDLASEADRLPDTVKGIRLSMKVDFEAW